jgi:hypothetical protein
MVSITVGRQCASDWRVECRREGQDAVKTDGGD